MRIGGLTSLLTVVLFAQGALSAVAPTVIATAVATRATVFTDITRIVATTSSTNTTKIASTSSTKLTSTTLPTTVTNSTSTKPTSTPTQTPDPTVILDGPRTTDIFATIKGIYDLPDGEQVIRNATLNATNIQGDILVGMKKKLELFYFFTINNPESFKKKLHNQVVQRITNTLQLLNVGSQPVVCLNLAFSQSGLIKLGITANLADTPFAKGQTVDANNLGDPGTKNWVPQFIGTKIHGVFLIASDTMTNINAMVSWLNSVYGSDITNVYSLQGNIRPPPYDGHEMFGFLDGVSQPAVAGFNVNPVPGQQLISPGIILVGEPGDTLASSRPSWAKDGSFLVFRQLKQLVPEWDWWLKKVAPPISGMTQDESAELLGARIMGRWKSGAPVDLTPLVDDPVLGADPNQNNDFTYAHPGFSLFDDEKHCPFAAHTRKTRPRADQSTPLNAIMRAGIPYGPELTSSELNSGVSSNTTALERGLAFVSYQSRIDLGFQFIQTQWANAVNFAPGKIHPPGFDLVFGQNNGGTRWMNGANIADTTQTLTLSDEFVISRGGEYFFSPSINALANVISV